jgi:GT2 family glycosyltransferase
MIDANGTEIVPPELASREYDLTSRHVLAARAIRALVPEGGKLLDLGGAAGLTGALLPGYRVVTVDVLPTAEVVASGDRLPFRSGSFEAVAILDVLEHVPESVRSGLVAEACRVSDRVVVAGPCRTAAVEAAEAHQRAIFEAMFGSPHPWLSEHEAAGLPPLDELEGYLDQAGLDHASFESNPLELWSALLFNTHVALRLGLDLEARALRSDLLHHFLDTADATSPGYRQVIVAGRDRPDIAQIAATISPASNAAAVSDWVDRAEVNTGRLIDRAMRLLDEARADLAEGWSTSVHAVAEQRRALDVAVEGWDTSVGRVRDLESALDSARRGWSETVDLATALGGELETVRGLLSEATETVADLQGRLARSDRTLAIAETLLVNHPEIWRDDLAGPPVTAPPAFDLSESLGSDYHRWRENRLAPPSPPADGPTFSVLVPVFDPDARFLEEAIRSVRRQTYAAWELILLDVSSEPHVAPICRRFASIDARVSHVRAENRGIAANTNAAAEVAFGDWLVLLDHDDELEPHALATIARTVVADPGLDFVYSDEDKIDGAGTPRDPFFKPDWSPELLRTVNYITHLTAIRRDLWALVGGMRRGYEGAQDYDLFLRATEVAKGIGHVADVLYHWRIHDASTAGDVRQKPHAHQAGRRALEELLEHAAPGAWVAPGPGPTNHRVRYPITPARVSIIVPFKDGSDLTTNALLAIDRYRNTLPFEVLLVSNRSTDAVTFRRIAEWEDRWDWVRVVSYDEPFNFQKLNNWAVEQVEGPLLLFLNNDAWPLHTGWMEALAEHAQRPEVGAVSGRLFYPNGLVQHAGVAVGIGGFAEHPWARLHPDTWTPAGPSYWTRDFLAVTAACLMIERSKFDEVDRFDERFTVGGGDVDLGLRLVDAGYRNVMTPYARLVHHESVTRGTSVPESDLIESRRSYRRYLDGRDPYYNRNLTLEDTSCRFASRQHLPSAEASVR